MNDLLATAGIEGFGPEFTEVSPWLDAKSSEQVQQALKVSALDDMELRVVHAYLGSPQFMTAARVDPILISNMQLVALGGYLAEKGYTVEGASHVRYAMNGSTISPPLMRVIDIAPGRKSVVPEEGMLFLRQPNGQRAILQVTTKVHDARAQLVAASMDMGKFFYEWEQYAARHAYLRGKQFYVSGELIHIDPPVRLEDLYLPEETWHLVKRTILSFPEQVKRYRRHHLAGKRGVILEGPPGTGKTMLCRALCSEINATFIWVTARHVETPSDVIASVWHLARMLQPTVILLEDLDLFTEAREYAFQSFSLGELMNQMDGVEDNYGILTIATTNRLSVVEHALRNRPGRFDRAIHLGELDRSGRRKLLEKHLSLGQLQRGLLEGLLHRTEGFTGARMVDLVKTLVELSGEDNPDQEESDVRITADMVDRAMEEFCPVGRRGSAGFMAECQGAA